MNNLTKVLLIGVPVAGLSLAAVMKAASEPRQQPEAPKYKSPAEYTAEIEHSQSWRKDIAQRLGFQALDYVQAPSHYGGANDWQDARKLLDYKDDELCMYTFKNGDIENMLIIAGDGDLIPDDEILLEVIHDEDYEVFAWLQHDGEKTYVMETRGAMLFESDLSAEQLADAIGDYVRRTYPPKPSLPKPGNG